MADAACHCCQDSAQCPSIPGWITLHTWRGSYVVPNDLRAYLVWTDLKLDDWQQAVWLWRIVSLNTGDVANFSQMCLAQNRRAHHKWTAPAGLDELFTAEFEPLQVGTTWKGRIRTAYGEPIKRAIRESNYLVPPPTFGAQDYFVLSFTNGGITTSTPTSTPPGLPPYRLSVTASPADVQSALEALPNIGAGNVICSGNSLAAGGPIVVEFTGALAALNVNELTITMFDSNGPRTVSVLTDPAGSFGVNEQQRIFIERNCGDKNEVDTTIAIAEFQPGNGTVIVDATRPFEFALQIQCLGCNYAQQFALWGQAEGSLLRFADIYDDNDIPGVCPAWAEHYSNTPYRQIRTFGPDGVDGHLRADRFVADGAMATRLTVCEPNVVLLGDGCWLEQDLSAKYDPWSVHANGQIGIDCPNKPINENLTEQPTSDLSRLKSLYGSDFSYWGGWIDHVASLAAGVIITRFDEYDLTDVKVLFVGGMMAGSMGPLSGVFGDTNRYLPGGPLVNFDFATGALEPLKKWLDQGERVLVLDGGIWPQKFFGELGLMTTVEPFGQYVPGGGAITANTLNFKQWGPELPDFLDEEFHQTYFQELYVDPEPHPFTTGVPLANTSAGAASLVTDPTISGSGIAGQPPGTGGVNRGLINLSQKWRFDLELKPAAGLRSYTSAVPLVVPGPNAEVIGRVKGEVPVAPWFVAGAYVTVDVDYPGVVCDSWKASFRLRFDHAGVIADTAILPPNATAAQIQAALAALPNIAANLTVLGGPLPYDVQIFFDAGATQQLDVAQIEVLDSGCWRVDTTRDGVPGSVDELQLLSRVRSPSRVVISQINELIEPDAWGNNWDNAHLTAAEADMGFHVGQNSAAEEPYSIGFDVAGNLVQTTYADYDRRGYAWGRGLSAVAAAQFLVNLRDRRTEVW